MFEVFKRQIIFVTLFHFVCFPLSAWALPQSGTVVGGSADSFSYSSDTLTIKQNSNRLVTDWDGFSIGRPESVIFNQPGASSIALNRVVGVDPSRILGTLSANGRVFLTNPNGIVFGVNSVVDTAGLLASTLELDMSVADFIAGSNNFTFSGPGGSVVNYGKISLNGPGGYVALLGSSVKNVGLIEANLGTVILAAGEQMTLDLDPAGVISAVINVIKETDRNDNNEYAAVNNFGKIKADGGKVILTADILDGVFKSAVNNDGIIEANSVNSTDGLVLLKSNQNIELNGTIEASGAIDAYALEDIILGRPVEDITLSNFAWLYLGGDRSYLFKEFGYYYGDGSVRVVLSRGMDIGKDAFSPLSGAGIQELPGDPLGLYASFDPGLDLLTFFEEAALNPDGAQHLEINGSEYAWEDMLGLGDGDFNDAVIDFTEDITTVEAAGALLSSSNIFLTAKNGSITQHSGDIYADNLMLESNTGVSGTGSNGGILAHAEHLSALNKASGHIRVDNVGALTIADLRGVKGLNTGVTGVNGITNLAVGGEVNINVKGGEGADLNVEAPVESFGDVIFTADGNIAHNSLGDVLIHNPEVLPGSPTNLASPSHQVGVESEDRTVDVTWGLPGPVPGYDFIGNAGGVYAMAPGSEIVTQGGNADMTASGNIHLSLIDAQNGNVTVTSQNGSILDADLGIAPGDYDVVAHNIKLSAPNGIVGSPVGQQQIDLGFPYDFSFLWDNINNSAPDVLGDIYGVNFDTSTGDWQFSNTSDQLADGQWWFHVSTLGEAAQQIVSSDPAHIGPFIFSSQEVLPFWERIEKEFRVYYEILGPSQFLSFEPAKAIGLYAYHPLTPADYTAFDDIKLDIDAYEFIEDSIKMKKSGFPYFGL